MSSNIAIKIENLSKCFQIYENPRDRLKQFFLPKVQKLFGREPNRYYREFWALNNINFEVKKGETVGIVGRNGSGKSTLLQVICGTLSPSSGRVTTNGRIAALLELGSGFNPEFTGRENVYLNATVLGLSRVEIDARFDEIVDFADIGEFIDQPIKSYSSGMMVRLAFSVAINVKPQVLIVDEALSVGDELFQRKCFSKIESIRAAGATILFVSHSGSAVVELCDRALLVDSGALLALGAPKRIVASYQRLLYASNDERKVIREGILKERFLFSPSRNVDKDSLSSKKKDSVTEYTETRGELIEFYDPSLTPSSTVEYPSNGACISSPFIHTEKQVRVNTLVRGRTYKYGYLVNFKTSSRNVRFGMMIKTISGIELGGAASALGSPSHLNYVLANSEFAVEFDFVCSLNEGVYFLNAGVVGEADGTETYLHRVLDFSMFRVISDGGGSGTGIVDFSCSPKVQKISEKNI